MKKKSIQGIFTKLMTTPTLHTYFINPRDLLLRWYAESRYGIPPATILAYFFYFAKISRI